MGFFFSPGAYLAKSFFVFEKVDFRVFYKYIVSIPYRQSTNEICKKHENPQP